MLLDEYDTTCAMRFFPTQDNFWYSSAWILYVAKLQIYLELNNKQTCLN